MSRKMVSTVIGGALMMAALAGGVQPAAAQTHDRLRVPVGRAEVVTLLTTPSDHRAVAVRRTTERQG